MTKGTRIPVEIRKAIIASNISGKTYRDIAAKFDVSREAVRRIIYRHKHNIPDSVPDAAMYNQKSKSIVDLDDLEKPKGEMSQLDQAIEAEVTHRLITKLERIIEGIRNGTV